MTMAYSPALPMRTERTLFGHPIGLVYIVFTEAWERFSFYGMQGLLVLYMANHLLHPGVVETVSGFAAFRAVLESVFGPLTTHALATQIFGLYGGFIYLMPVFGGLAGDRWLGRRRAVMLGAGLMAFGHFLMAIEGAFLFALLTLIIGCGFLKGNIAAQVGDLYAREDRRRDSAYSVYYLAINVGAAVAPLICGTLGELYGWHYGFGAAGIGMLIGLVIYIAGRNHLPADPVVDKHAAPTRLSASDKRAIAGLLVVLAISILFWTAQAQVWNTYVLWVQDRLDRSFLGLTVPVTWFQSLDSFAVLALAPLMLWFWRAQARRGAEPGDLVKIALGCAIFGCACFCLGLAEFVTTDAKVPLLWAVAFHFICASGYLYVAPVSLALFSRAAPPSVNAMMVGIYYVSIFAGSVASGWLGRFYQEIPTSLFWSLHGAIVASAAIVIVVAYKPLVRVLQLRREEERAAS